MSESVWSLLPAEITAASIGVASKSDLGVRTQRVEAPNKRMQLAGALALRNVGLCGLGSRRS